MPAAFTTGYGHESMRHRAYLRVPRALPFLLLLADACLVAPWPRRPRGELLAWQTDQLNAVLARLAETARARGLPGLAWCTADAITAIRVPDFAWIHRMRLADAMRAV